MEDTHGGFPAPPPRKWTVVPERGGSRDGTWIHRDVFEWCRFTCRARLREIKKIQKPSGTASCGQPPSQGPTLTVRPQVDGVFCDTIGAHGRWYVCHTSAAAVFQTLGAVAFLCSHRAVIQGYCRIRFASRPMRTQTSAAISFTVVALHQTCDIGCGSVMKRNRNQYPFIQ